MSGPKGHKLHRDVALLITLIIVGFSFSWQFTRVVVVPAMNLEGVLSGIYATGVGLFGSPALLNAGLLGIVGGLLIVWLFDTYKQLQVFFPISIILGFVVATEFSVQTFVSGAVVSKLFVAAIFLIAVLYTLNIRFHRLITARNLLDEQPREFKLVPQLALWGVIGIAVLSLADIHLLASTEPTTEYGFVVNSIMAGVLILLFGFMSVYESNTQILIIGPSKSGKTSLLGGLYSDIDATDGSDNGNTREVAQNRLASISNEIANKHRVPDWDSGTDGSRPPEWTWDEEFIHFSYFERGRIFRKKKSIATLDYGGEMLRGSEDEKGFAQMYRTYRENVEETSSVVDTIKSLLSIVAGSSSSTQWSKANYEDKQTMIGETIHQSDVLLFTLPLDDFLEVPIRHGEAPPDYSDIIIIERVQEDSTDNCVYELHYSAPQKESKQIRAAGSEEPGDYYHLENDSQFKEFTFEFDQLPKIEAEKRYLVNKSRDPREEYLEEYEHIIREINPNNYRDILWTVTMTDLQNWRADADSVPGQSDAYQYGNNLFEKVRGKYRRTTLQDEDTSDLEDFIDEQNIFETTKTPETDQDVYKLLSLWVKNQYLSESSKEIDDWLEATGSEFVYPVWYKIDGRDSDDLLIFSDNGRYLKCSQYLIEGIEGNQLSTGYVMNAYNRTTSDLLLHQLSPLQDSNLDSPVDRAHQKMQDTFYEEYIRTESES